MKVLSRSLCVTATLLLLLIGFGLGNIAVASHPEKCEGSELRGAWFTALNPSGMHVSVSRDTTDKSGALSVWLISEDGTTEFFCSLLSGVGPRTKFSWERRAKMKYISLPHNHSRLYK